MMASITPALMRWLKSPTAWTPVLILPGLLGVGLYHFLPPLPNWTATGKRFFSDCPPENAVWLRDDDFIYLHDRATGRELWTAASDGGCIQNCLSRDGRRMALAWLDPSKRVTLLDARSRQSHTIGTATVGEKAHYCEFSPDGNVLLLGSLDGDYELLVDDERGTPFAVACPCPRKKHCHSFHFMPDNRSFVAIESDDDHFFVHRWDRASRRWSIQPLKAAPHESPNGRFLLESIENEGTVWDLVSGSKVSIPLDDRLQEFSLDSRFLFLVLLKDQKLKIWDLEAKGLLTEIQAPHLVSPFRRLRYRIEISPDKSVIAANVSPLKSTRPAEIYSAATGQRLWQMPDPVSVTFTRDSKHIVVLREKPRRIEHLESRTGRLHSTKRIAEPAGTFQSYIPVGRFGYYCRRGGWTLPGWMDRCVALLPESLTKFETWEAVDLEEGTSIGPFVCKEMDISRDETKLYIRTTGLACYDLPLQRPWGWILGPSIVLAVLGAAWLWWRSHSLRLADHQR